MRRFQELALAGLCLWLVACSSDASTDPNATAGAAGTSPSAGAGNASGAAGSSNGGSSGAAGSSNGGASGAAGSSPTGGGGTGGAVETRCGGRSGGMCASNEYCAYVEGQLCGAADASAKCQRRPGACDEVLMPVCGCDGKTYSDECDAASHGSGVYASGACTK